MPPPHGELKDVDMGWRAALKALAQAAGKPDAHVVVGWPASSGQHRRSGMSVAQIAAVHEFGTARVPQRSMLAATYDQNEAKYADAARKVATGVLLGRTDLRRGLDLIGVMIKGDVQRRIAAGVPPPLSPVTIARKGSSTPLIDTGQMRAALDHEVRGA
jgi:hypothetical protein